jgi:hypothetical protein
MRAACPSPGSGFVANNRAIRVIEVHELARASGLVRQHGFRLLRQEERFRL